MGFARFQAAHLGDETIATAWDSLNVSRVLRVILQYSSYLTDAVVESLLKINKGFFTPEFLL